MATPKGKKTITITLSEKIPWTGVNLRSAAFVAFTELNDVLLNTIQDIQSDVTKYDVLQRLEDFLAQWEKSKAKKVLEEVLPDEIQDYNEYF